MKLSAFLRSVFFTLFHRSHLESEMDEELRLHVQHRADHLERSGLPRAEAERRARIEFGGQERFKEECREALGTHFLESFLQDVRFAFRMLRKSPGFTAVAVLTIALGIGANTAIFSMVDALVLRPLPVYAPNEIASLVSHDKSSGSSNGLFSYPDFEDIRSETSSVFGDVTAVRPFQMDGLRVGGQGEPTPIWTSYVTPNFFQVMGLQPALGSFFQPDESRMASSDPVLVLDYSFWKTHLGGDPAVVGRSVSINGHPLTVIGVAPENFHGLFSILVTQGYLPIGMAPVNADSKSDFLTNRKANSVVILGRLKPGVQLGEAQPVLGVIARRLSERYPEIHKWDSLQAFPVGPLGPDTDWSGREIVNAMAAFFLVLVGLVLVLACMNVANLLLVRASAREREMTVRAALGAGRGRLVRQMLTESLLLALLGCAGGILLGLAVSRLFSSWSLSSELPLVFNFDFNWRVFTYACGGALLTGLLVGITPAVRAARGNLGNLVHETQRTATARRQRARSLLVVAQLSGSLMLLIVAGLFVRSLQAVERSDLGFEPAQVVNLSVAPTEAGYNEAQGRQFLQGLLQQTSALPGVESASLAATVPLGYYSRGSDGLKIEGYETPPGQAAPHAGYNSVSSAYFRTMRIPLVRGRGILDSDGETSQHVALINEEMAKRYWPNQDPLGRRFAMPDDLGHPIQVIGVVKNVRTEGLSGPYGPYFYRPLAQDYQVPVTLQLRTNLSSATVISEAVDVVHSLAPAMPVFDTQTMTQALDTLNGLLLYQFGAVLTASLGILGLVLALVGVYGVVSYAASQRTQEIGIRMALGAHPSQILKKILGQGLVLTAAGVFIGVLLANAIGRLAGDFLSGVSPADPLTYLCASGLLIFVTLTACYIPARRAMRTDPVVALRYE